eukprot:CAMPEP_0204332646 /NCGR_PEP_ID=MMETSP0469-20131031/16625_1 /ASSEMBLY_ACC=CAM_ASM_000384 /TAXON_ID=2969 /ORGANISM="Oxyrrhis marina" /LENGTH=63 /DNA_ID=CAMNT_0051315833 /DNA_START=145 /DNA_END=333 /DNA_ORIENTATION=-
MGFWPAVPGASERWGQLVPGGSSLQWQLRQPLGQFSGDASSCAARGLPALVSWTLVRAVALDL